MRSRLLSGATLPHRLADLAEPPEQLSLLGELPRGPAVAIVGTRGSSEPARLYARQLAAKLAQEGISVWSGGAEGIDAAAHEGALSAAGKTVVVAPAGFQRPFPEKHKDLFERVVASGGAYLSLCNEDEPATRAAFFPRNATLVALTHCLVVVEAGFRSGARNAAKWARRLRRPVWVTPAPPWHPNAVGTLLELRLGARPLIGVRDILRELADLGLHGLPTGRVQLPLRLPAQGPEAAADLRGREERVLAALEAGATHIDAIVQQTGLSAAAAHAAVLTLTLEGVLVPDPTGGLHFVSRQNR